MLNVQNITAKLASLPDQALQQYAAMNKNDPYIMALAVSESNRRKQVRAAQQAQGMQEQPKVVDQAVAEMAPQQPMPEDVGIGQLPAGEMEFAEGGILAFAPGGATGGPNASFVQFLSSIGKSARDFVEATPKEQQALKAAFEKATPGPRMTAPTAAAPSAAATSTTPKASPKVGALGRLSRYAQNPVVLGLGAAYEASKIPAVRDTVSGAYGAIKDFAMSDRFLSDEDRAVIQPPPPAPPAPRPDVPAGSTIESDAMRNRSRAAVASVVPPTPTAPQMPAGPTGIEQVAGPTAATAAPVSMDYAGAATGMEAAGLFPQATDADFADEKTQKEDVAKEAVALGKKGLTREEDFQKKLGEYGVNKEKRLKEREADLSKDEKSNYGLAFLEAGLAMMGGESPNAFANISKGALQGMGSYKTGLAKLNDRKEKLFDAYDALDDARRSDKKDKFARIEAANDKIDKATIALKQVGADIATKKGDFNRNQTNEFTKAVVQTANTQYTTQNQAAEKAADRATQVSVAEAKMASDRAIAQFGAASNRAIAEGQQATQRFIAELPGDMQKLYTTLGKGDPVAGLKLAKEMEAAGKKDIMTVYNDWLKANPTLAMDPNKAMATFFKQYAVMSGKVPQASDKPTGKVLDKSVE